MVFQAMIKTKRRDRKVLQQLLMKNYRYHYNNQFDNNINSLSQSPLTPFYNRTSPNQIRKHNKDRDKLGKQINLNPNSNTNKTPKSTKILKANQLGM